jgi:hypothetical protein
MSETGSGNETTFIESDESPVNVAPVRNPAQSPRQTTPPRWVVDKNSLMEWEDACWSREAWRLAVAKWRKDKQQRPAGDVDLVKDEKFQAMILNRHSWSHGRH